MLLQVSTVSRNQSQVGKSESASSSIVSANPTLQHQVNNTDLFQLLAQLHALKAVRVDANFSGPPLVPS